MRVCVPVIFLHAPRVGVKLTDDTPRLSVLFFCFLMLFNVNLGFVYVYTPQKFVHTPQFQIPRNNSDVYHPVNLFILII